MSNTIGPKDAGFTDTRPWVDASNKHKLVEAVMKHADRTQVSNEAIDEIVKGVGPKNPPAAVAFLKRLKEVCANDSYQSFDIRDACQKAKDAYWNLEKVQPRTAGVFGLEMASALDRWTAAHDILAEAGKLADEHALGGAIDTSQAEAVIAELEPTMRPFADGYDAMLRGEKSVSDFMPKATLFALFPELKGKDLPATFEALADLVGRADEGLLVGLFNHRWLEPDSVRVVEGPLRGDLNEFVGMLRADAHALRHGSIFGTSEGWGTRAVRPMYEYLRGTRENPEEGYGLIPTFLHQLATPSYQRAAFTFGDEARAKFPTYANSVAAPRTVTVETTADGAKLTFG